MRMIKISMMGRSTSARRGDKGVSLIELLLSTAILIVMVVGATAVLNSWIDRGINRQASEDIGRIQSAAEAYVAMNYHDAAICASTGSEYHEIELSRVQDAGFIKENYSVGGQYVTAMKQPLRAFVKCNAAGTNPSVPVPAMAEVLVLSQGVPAKAESLTDAVLAGGPRVGTFLKLDGANITLAGMGNGWVIDNSTVQQLLNMSTPVTAPTEEGGYLASYGRISDAKTANKDFLYRVNIDDDPSYNTMSANLNMDSNAITNVGVLTTSKLKAATVSVDVPSTTATTDKPDMVALTVDGYLSTGSVQAGKNLSVYGGKMKAGSLTSINSPVNARNVTVNGTSVVTGSIAADTLSVSGPLTVKTNAAFNALDVSDASNRVKSIQTGVYSSDKKTTTSTALIGQMAGTSTLGNAGTLQVYGSRAGDAALKLNTLNLNAGVAGNGTVRTKMVSTPTGATNFTCKSGAYSAPQCENYIP